MQPALVKWTLLVFLPKHKSVLVYHVGAVLHIGKPVKTFPAKLYYF